MMIIDKIETLCNICCSKINANVIKKNGFVYYEKSCLNTYLCRQKKKIDVLISVNADNYNVIDESKIYKNFGMGILEIIQSCNIKCATCIADSEPGKEGILSFNEIKTIVNKVELDYNKPDILVLSGGEPTIHPEFLKILDFISKKEFKHIIIISNGIKFAENIELSEILSKLNKKIEVYLQFDSLTPNILKEIRGENLLEKRLKSLDNLNKYNIPTTLVSVVKKGLNEHELCDVINIGMSYKCVRGVTFQPIRATGRHSSFSESSTITLSEVCNLIEEGLSLSKNNTFLSHPMNPNHISYIYYSKNNNNNTNLIYNFLHKNKQFFLYPEDNKEEFDYDKTFRIFVVEYMDKFNFNFKDLNMSAIGIIQNNGDIIPIEKHYLDIL